MVKIIFKKAALGAEQPFFNTVYSGNCFPYQGQGLSFPNILIVFPSFSHLLLVIHPFHVITASTLIASLASTLVSALISLISLVALIVCHISITPLKKK
jgi:hypothetical protein